MTEPDAGHVTGSSPACEAVSRALARVPWLRDCGQMTRTLLLRRSRLSTYQPGESIVRRGEPADGLLIVAAGSVETSTSTAAGRRVVVSYIGPGHVVGLVPLLDGRGAIHDTIAQATAEVLWIADEDFHAAIDADPWLRRRVMGLLASRARRLHGALVDSNAMPLPVRLARVLLSLQVALGATMASDGVVRLRLSQEGLAAMLGVPRQRINVELSALARERVLRMGYMRIELLDLDALRVHAQEPTG